MANQPPIAVNTRSISTGRSTTGVQRWARAVTTRLVGAESLGPSANSSGPVGHAWEQIILPARFKLSRADVLLSPANWGPVAVRSQVVVVHDVAPALFPDTFPSAYVRQFKLLLPLLSRRATLATVSERSKVDLCRILNLAPADVQVLGCGAELPLSRRAHQELDPYFLFVGGHDPRKNLSFLLKIWPEFYAESGCLLIATTRSASSTFSLTLSEQFSDQPWLRLITDPSDEALSELYNGCVSVLQTSLYEGFGLPILEGLAHGRPFISSDVGAARELVAPGVRIVDLDRAKWFDALLQVTGAPDPRDDIEARKDVARSFSWDAIADRTMSLLQSV